MKEVQNVSRQGFVSSVIEEVVSNPSNSNTENYADGMVLSYLDSLMSGNQD